MGEIERHALVQQLGRMMSDISEDCYYAGWMGGTEYLVPELCRRAVKSGRAQHWGHGEVTPEKARELIALAERAGGWADTDEAGAAYCPFDPFPMPPEYLESIEREQEFEHLRHEAAKGRREHFDRWVRAVPDLPPAEGDRLE